MWTLVQSLTSHVPAGTPAFVADMAVKGALILAAALMILPAMRRSSSSARHLVLAAGLCGALALPLCTVALPRIDIVVPRPAALDATPAGATAEPRRTTPAFQRLALRDVRGEDGAASAASRHAEAPSGAPSGVVSAGATSGTVSAAGSRRAQVDWGALAVIVWAAGALVSLVPMLAGLLVLFRMTGASRLLTDADWSGLLGEVLDRIGSRHPVRLMQSDRIAVPMTWGFVRPVVLLPASASLWPRERRRAVLLHELSHIERWDYLTQVCGRLACAIHWFNPLAWFAFRRMLALREQACDDRVLRAGVSQSDYAGHLLQIARSARTMPAAASAAMLMARKGKTTSRVEAILAATNNRRALSMKEVSLCLLAVTCLVAPLSVIHAATAESATSGHGEVAPAATQGDVAAEDAHPGAELVFRIDTAGMTDAQQTDLTRKTVDILRDRIDPNDQKGILIQAKGQYRILMRLPGYTREATKDMIALATSPGKLEWRLVAKTQDGAKIADLRAGKAVQGFAWYPYSTAAKDMADPEGPPLSDGLLVVTDDGYDVTEELLSSVRMTKDQAGAPAVGFEFKPEGAKRFSKMTGDHIGDRIAIILNNKICSAPRVGDRISGSGIIMGIRTAKEVDMLVKVLNSGSLKAPLVLESERYLNPLPGKAQEKPVEETAAPAAESSAATITLKHDSGTMKDYQSIGGSGHFVNFECASGKWYLTGIQIYGSRYGTDVPPKETWTITLCDADFKAVRAIKEPYSTFEKGDSKWYTIDVPRLELPSKDGKPLPFWINVDFIPHMTKGVYVGYDGSADETYSKVGLPGEKGESMGGHGEWMIRAIVTQRPGNGASDNLGKWIAPGGEPLASLESQGLVELADDGGKSSGMRSIGGRGPAVTFTCAADGAALERIRIYGSRYGINYDPASTPALYYVLDDKGNVITSGFFFYAAFDFQPKWVEVKVTPVQVPKTFSVLINPNATQYQGIYFHYDSTGAEKPAKAGASPDSIEDFKGSWNWMIRAGVRPGNGGK